jgi:predicted ATPase
MIREIKIENYKSIQKLKLSLGRVTVFIGENGCGKSNILEAIALASAAANDKLDNEFLVSRGIRVTEPQFMRSAFEKNNITQQIKFYLEGINQETTFGCILQNNNTPYSKWRVNEEESIQLQVSTKEMKHIINKIISEIKTAYREDEEHYVDIKEHEFLIQKLLIQEEKNIRSRNIKLLNLESFLIYSPENYHLRIFEREGQIQPLGINGEGLFKLLKFLDLDENQGKINEIKEKIKVIDWFKDFEIPKILFENEKTLKIQDRYLDPALSYFDQKSANEGFLFLLFYFTLFISCDTPKFFAIDNIDASLNPKLSSQLIKELVSLAKKYDKQVIFTTHNPAILDGLNLDDDEQRLLVIYRNKLGHTKAKRILKPEPLEGQEPVKLSEAFMKGYLGGLPKGF